MRLEVTMKGVMVESVRVSEVKDDRGRAQGAKRYAQLVWMGGQQSLIVDPSIEEIPENVPLDITIEGSIKSALVEMGREKYRRDVVLLQKLIRLEKKPPARSDETKNSPTIISK